MIDPRGMGETAPPLPKRGENYSAVDRLAFLSLHLNRPLLGQRVFDLLQSFRALQPSDGSGTGLHLIADGPAALVALHAAALDDNVKSVELTHLLTFMDGRRENAALEGPASERRAGRPGRLRPSRPRRRHRAQVAHDPSARGPRRQAGLSSRPRNDIRRLPRRLSESGTPRTSSSSARVHKAAHDELPTAVTLFWVAGVGTPPPVFLALGAEYRPQPPLNTESRFQRPLQGEGKPLEKTTPLTPRFPWSLIRSARQVPTGSTTSRRDNREDGANPSRGRRCDRPGPRTIEATAARREGCPRSVTSREPEDLPVESCSDASATSIRAGRSQTVCREPCAGGSIITLSPGPAERFRASRCSSVPRVAHQRALPPSR